MKISCFVRTDQDWYPSYQLDGWNKGIEGQKLLELSFFTFSKPTPDAYYRICVWGGDDFGMERDFPQTDHDKAWHIFTKILKQKKVGKGFLEDLGFINA